MSRGVKSYYSFDATPLRRKIWDSLEMLRAKGHCLEKLNHLERLELGAAIETIVKENESAES